MIIIVPIALGYLRDFQLYLLEIRLVDLQGLWIVFILIFSMFFDKSLVDTHRVTLKGKDN